MWPVSPVLFRSDPYCKMSHIKSLEENGPSVSLFMQGEVAIILLRDGKEEHHVFQLKTIEIMFPQSPRSTYPIPANAPDYFIYVPATCPGMNAEIIPLSKDEAEIIAYKIYELNSAAEAEEAEDASYDDNECAYCGSYHDDDDRESVTSVELRVNARIVADERAKMNNEIEQEKRAVENEWADARNRIIARHEALLAEGATKQLNERMRYAAAELAQ